MPRNDVVERVAERLYRIDFKDYIAFGHQILPWEKLKEVVRQTYRNDALELLGIVEEYTYEFRPQRNYTCRPPQKVCLRRPLLQAFRLVRKAREKGAEKK